MYLKHPDPFLNPVISLQATSSKNKGNIKKNTQKYLMVIYKNEMFKTAQISSNLISILKCGIQRNHLNIC